MKWEQTLTMEYVMGQEEIPFFIRITEEKDEWHIFVQYDSRPTDQLGAQTPIRAVFETVISRKDNDVRMAKATAGKLMRFAYEKIVSGKLEDDMYGNDPGDEDEEDDGYAL